MRFKEDREDATDDHGEHRLEVESLVQLLQSADVSEAARAAEAIYKMTSFASAVCIDDRSAMTSYDLSVFGGEPAEAPPPEGGDAPPPDGGDDGLGDVHVDGKRYGMGDGFMLSCDEGEGAAKGKAWRRVAVRPPPWSQPRGKTIVSFANSHTNATRIGWHLWEIDLRFSPGLPPGWLNPQR